MKRSVFRTFVGGAAASLLLFGIQPVAKAVTAVDLTICQGAVCTTVVNSPIAAFSGTVGDYLITAGVGSFIEGGTSQAAGVQLNVLRTATSSVLPLVMTVTVYGYQLPVGSLYNLTSTGATTVTRTTGNEIASSDYQAWVDFTNSGLLTFTNGLITCTAPGGAANSCNVAGSAAQFAGTTPFSMTIRTTLNFLQLGSVWGTTGQAIINAVPVPEPGTLALLGIGLLGLGVAQRRKI